MWRSPVRVLIVEDSKEDYALLEHLFSKIEKGAFHLDWVDNYEEALIVTSKKIHDVYLLDYHLDSGDGLSLLKKMQAEECSAPTILLSGQGDYQIDLEAMELGAMDYLVKGQITASLLERSVRYAIERKRIEIELRQSQEKLVQLAQYDPLTGLANRSLFLIYLSGATARANRHRNQAAVVLIDLDRFKDINENLGHEGGDILLKSVAERLRKSIRTGDFIARLGGNEFALILENIENADGLAVIAEKILNRLKEV